MTEVKLPRGWAWKKLGEVCKKVDKTALKFHHPDAEFKYIDIDAVDNRNFKITNPKSYKWRDAPSRAQQIVKSGDIVFSTVRTYLKNIATVPEELDTQIASTGFCVLRPDSKTDSKYLFYYILTEQFQRPLNEIQRGTSYPAVRNSDVLEQPVPLPSIHAQKAILAKIEELFSELEAGVQELQIALNRLKVYRQAVLDWAFKGELTKDWRANCVNLTPARDLLENIQINRTMELNKRGKKLRHTIPISNQEIEKLPIIPYEWCWVKPEDVCSPEDYSIGIGPFGSNLKVSDYKPHGVPLIFVKNITRNNFHLDLRFISEIKFVELRAHSVKPLDILITKMGDPPGDCAIYPVDCPEGIITSDCLKFRVWDSFVERSYFKFCIESQLIKNQLGFITQGVAQKKISSERFKTLCFPLPSKAEQIQIVLEIEARLSEADMMETAIRQELVRAENLQQSILKQAFEGRLITDETDIVTVSEPVTEYKAASQKLNDKSEQLSLF